MMLFQMKMLYSIKQDMMIMNGKKFEEAGMGYLKIIFWNLPGETERS